MHHRPTAGCDLVALALLLGGCAPKAQASPPPPPDVVVAQVLQRDVPIYIEAIGQTRGSTEIEIRARVEGFLESVDFEEGTMVQKGQLLYTIDPLPFEAALARAKAGLAQAAADLARAHQDVVRYEPLVAKNAISREEYETAVAIEQAASAAEDAAEAVVQSAEIDLGYTRVLAPVDGLVGKTEVHPGALVSRVASTLLTQISTIDPIRARITLSEREYLYYARRAESEGRGGEPPKALFELILADGTIHPHPGSLVFVDRAVDPRSGTILVETSFPNPGGIVRPGQYARARVAVEVRKGALLVPQRAVQELQGIYNVVVVGEDDTVEMRAVQPGERVGDLWVIDSGLKPGERIVVEGLQKVRPGIVVAAKEVRIEDRATSPDEPREAREPEAPDAPAPADEE